MLLVRGKQAYGGGALSEDKCQKRGRPYLKAVNSATKTIVVYRPDCGMWNCPSCARKNADEWREITVHGVNVIMSAGVPMKFVTLTSHERLDQTGSIKVWPAAWKKLNVRANRAAGKGTYLLVPEQHKDGRMHMHMIVDWSLSERWWKDNARECGLGYMAKVEPIGNPVGAAFYVTKYLTKQMELNAWPARFRHIRVSRDWPRKPEYAPDAQNWRFAAFEGRDKVDSELTRYALDGWQIMMSEGMSLSLAIKIADNGGVVE